MAYDSVGGTVLLFGGLDGNSQALRDTWTWNGTVPVVTSVNPAIGTMDGGTSVQITGTGFSRSTGETTVRFGSLAASNVSCSSTTMCTATAPKGTGVVHVTVAVNGLVSTISSDDRFTYVLLGDVNGDGLVNAVDALCVLRYVAALATTPACLQAPTGPTDLIWDVNNDRTINAVDALCISRSVAGLAATSTCPSFAPEAAPGAAGPAMTAVR